MEMVLDVCVECRGCVTPDILARMAMTGVDKIPGFADLRCVAEEPLSCYTVRTLTYLLPAL